MESVIEFLQSDDFQAVFWALSPILIPAAFALYRWLLEQLRKRSPEYLQGTLLALAEFGYRVAEQRYKAGLIQKEQRMDHAVAMAQQVAKRVSFRIEDDELKSAIEFVISRVKEAGEKKLGIPNFD